MSQVLIACPRCGKELRLRDRSNIGKKGKCPSCQHTFVLQEPEEVPLELADSIPAVGTSARWVPDEAPAAAAGPFAASSFPAPPPAAPAVAEGLPLIAAEDGGIARVKAIKRRGKRRRNTGILVGGLVALMVGGTAVALVSTGALSKSPAPTESAAQQANGTADPGLVEVADAAEASAPRGEPIDLRMVPTGASAVIHLRVGELWKPGSQGEEFRSCFGPLHEWLEAKLKEHCLFDPATEIDSVLLCLFYRAPGETPELSGVVRLKEPVKRSVFITKFGGEPDQGLGYPVFKTSETAYAIAPEDPKSFAFCPVGMASEMVGSITRSSPTVGGIEELLPHTDRERHVTVVFRPDDARVHQQGLVAENLLPFWNQFLDWVNPDEVESVAWSLRLDAQQFRSEMVLRNKSSRSPPMLQRDLRKKLDALGTDLLEVVEKMEPKEAGPRQLIGRFPAMMQVVGLGTTAAVADRYVHLTTVLPERAAPNLALAGLLAWDESTRTDFNKTKSPGTPAAPARTGDEPIVVKLQKKIEIDFRRTPLQDAIAYISENTGVTFDIDGDGGLKSAGYTKNMAQEMKLGIVPATDALKEILKKYKGKTSDRDDMCLIIDEEKKVVTLTTKGGAEKLGKTPAELK